MIKDSISYISKISGDSVLAKDTIHQQSPFGMPVEGEMVDLMERESVNDMHITQNEPKEDNRHEGVRLPFMMEQADGIFGILLLCFLFFTHLYNGGITLLKENFSLLFSSSSLTKMSRQTTAKEFLYSYFLIFQMIALLSICVYDILSEYYPTDGIIHNNPLIVILSFIVLISIFFLVKDLIYQFLGYIFDLRQLIDVWRQIQIRAIETLGVLYFIPALLLVYADYYHFQIVVLMLILFLIVQIILFYQIILFFIKEKFNFLYLIAYLCTFEILPYIFLMLGLVYLYRIDVLDILWH